MIVCVCGGGVGGGGGVFFDRGGRGRPDAPISARCSLK